MTKRIFEIGEIGTLEVIKHRQFRDSRGVLVPIEIPSAIPFPVVRLFWVRDVPAGTGRGGHGHKVCRQYMICVTGGVLVDVTDGKISRRFELTAGDALDVQPGLFASETYQGPDSTLLVLCDRPFEAEDYLDNLEDLQVFRAGGRG